MKSTLWLVFEAYLNIKNGTIIVFLNFTREYSFNLSLHLFGLNHKVRLNKLFKKQFFEAVALYSEV